MNQAEKLIQFIKASPSVFHVIDEGRKILDEHGFEEVTFLDNFSLEDGKKYYITINDSSLIAFQGTRDFEGIRMIGSHSDSPSLKIKPKALIKDRGYYKLNVEVYGGAILSTWLDRPLSLAGRVALRGKDAFHPLMKHINVDRDLLVIPNLAIHMDREINKGHSYNPQLELLPIIGLGDKDFTLEGLLANELQVEEEEILDYELYLYDRMPGSIVGYQGEFISVGKIDNLGMVYPSLQALVDSQIKSKSISLIYIADNEEIGSRSKQGAGGTFLRSVVEKICMDHHKDLSQVVDASFLISGDQTHGYHPNYSDKNDLTNFPLLNGGPAIKYAPGAYTTDAYSGAVIREIAGNLPLQNYVNRSDIKGGSTIGPITMGNLSVNAVDLGNPLLAMHSIRELGGVKDCESIHQLFLKFFEE